MDTSSWSYIVVLLLVCGTKCAHSIKYVAWKPGEVSIYRIRTKLQGSKFSTENGGLVVDYSTIVTRIGPDTVHMISNDLTFVGIEDEIQTKLPILSEIRRYVESPVELILESGAIKTFRVESNLPDWAIDMMKEQVSHFSINNAFLRAQQLQSSNSNYHQYIYLREDGIVGNCVTKYNIYRLNTTKQKVSSFTDIENEQNESVINRYNNLCSTGDKLYKLVKYSNLINFSGETDTSSTTSPVAVTRSIVCGRRSQNKFKFLQIHHEIGIHSRIDILTRISLIETHRARPVQRIHYPKIVNKLVKSKPPCQSTDPDAAINLSFYKHPSSNLKKVVLAHMANTPAAMRWALAQGANGVGVDLRFSGDNPFEFQNSVGLHPCDCTCACPFGGLLCPKDSICKALWSETGRHCTASTPVETMTRAFGDEDVRSKLALIYIDSKLSNSMVDYFGVGFTLVKILDLNTFERGYQGQVLISGSEVKYTDYLKGALEAAQQSKYADKYFFTFSNNGKNYGGVWDELLQLRSDKIAYQTGASSCLPGSYTEAIQKSLDKDAYAGVGIWTLDKSSTMKEYLDLGVDLIMTHKPSLAKALIGNNLATPGNALVPKPVPDPSPGNWECDCNYHFGGCTISKAAPPNTACRCTYVYLTLYCYGRTVPCVDLDAVICKEPDGTNPACLFGGGDCGGY